MGNLANLSEAAGAESQRYVVVCACARLWGPAALGKCWAGARGFLCATLYDRMGLRFV